MIGVVLAAGAGRRLHPLTLDLPKTLLPVAGEDTILDIALHTLREVDVTEVAVVTGFAAERITERIDALEARHGVRITPVFNDKAEIWNNAYSLYCARDALAEGCLLVNGDTMHPAGVERTLLENRGPEILLAAFPVVFGLEAGGAGRLAHLVHFLGRAGAVVGRACLQELVHVTVIEISALALEIRAFVEIKAQPVHGVDDGVCHFLGRAGLIRVLDAQDEFAVVLAGVEIIEERGAGASDMQIPGGAGGETGHDLGHVALPRIRRAAGCATRPAGGGHAGKMLWFGTPSRGAGARTYTASTALIPGTIFFTARSMLFRSVIWDMGQPLQAPVRRTCTMPLGRMSTSST